MTAKRHLNGVSLAGRCWPAYGHSWYLDRLSPHQLRKKTLSKSQLILLHFKLKGIELTAPCEHIFCSYIYPQSVDRDLWVG